MCFSNLVSKGNKKRFEELDVNQPINNYYWWIHIIGDVAQLARVTDCQLVIGAFLKASGSLVSKGFEVFFR